MILNIFRLDGSREATVAVAALPADQDMFAREHGGDFCEPDAEPADDLLARIQAYTRENQ